MDCRIEKLVEYSAGRLPPAEAAAFERHLAACPECRRVAAAQSAAWNALDALDAPPVSPDFDRSLWARIACQEQRRWWAPLAAFFAWRPALAAVLACILIVAAVMVQRPRPANRIQAESIDPEPVERALDDLEMLQQFALVPAGQPEAM